MIPVRLTIQGMYSYREAQTIEFEALTSSKVFGIFGGVGSGKSTILEAISFALYNHTERLNKNDRNYNMMNLMSDSLLIDFIFLGDDGHQYRFVVKGKRNRKQFEKVGTFNRSAYRKNGEEWSPLEKNTAEDIIGLSYPNFRRTVIIPQGKFREFLELGPTERRKMLLELFGLEKFDLFDPTSRLFHTCNSQIENVTGQLTSLEEYSGEELSQLEASMKSSTARLESIEKHLQKYRQEHTRLLETKKLMDEQQQLQSQWEKITAEEDNIEALAQEIHQKLYCIEHFKAPLAALEEKKSSKQQLKLKQQANTAQISEIKRELKAAEDKLKALEKEYDRRDARKEELLAIRLLIQIKGLEQDAQKLLERRATGEEKLKAQEETTAQLEQQRASRREEVAKLKNKLPPVDTVNRLRKQQVEQQSLIKQIEEEQKGIKDLEERIGTLKREMDAGRQVFKTQWPQWAQVEEPDWDAIAEEVRLRIKALETELQQHQLKEELQAHADALEPGKPCLLCGSTEHPGPLKMEDVTAAIKALHEKIHACQQQLKSVEAVKVRMGQYEIQRREKEDQLAASKRKLDALQQAFDALKTNAAIALPAYTDYRESTALLAAIERDQKALEEREELLEHVSKSYEEASARLGLYRKTYDEIQTQLKLVQSKIQTLEDQIPVRLPDAVRSMDVTGLTSYMQGQQQALQQLTEAYEQAGTDARKAQTQLQILLAAERDLKGRLEEVEQQVEGWTEQLKKGLEAAPFETLQEVEAVLNSPLDIEAANHQIQTFREHRQAVQSRWSAIKAQLEGRDVKELDLESSERKLAEEEAKGQVLRDTIGRMKQRIEDVKTKLQQKQALQAQLDALQARQANLTLLRNMFKGGGFVDFVSTVHLRQLCITANKRFHTLTRHRLSLELKSDNTFLVRDYLNEGRVRSVSTLSGGQMFQLSLSLALALADSIRQYKGNNQNFFFLDEGFGTLDKESLRIVFDTLKALKKEDRIVGVISHVEALREEVEVAVYATNDEASGTVLRQSRTL